MAKQVEKKKFHQVEIPLLKREVELLGRDGEFSGRHIKIDLTNTLKGKGLEIKFIVEEVNGNLTTKPKQAYLQGFYIRRMLRKGTDYVEDSFLTESKDHRIRVKPLMITRMRVSRKVLKGLRIKSREEISKYVKNKTFETIVKDVMDGSLQKQLLPPLKKIYPLGLCEIRFIGIEELKEHEKYEQEGEKKRKEKEESQEEVKDSNSSPKRIKKENLKKVSDEEQ